MTHDGLSDRLLTVREVAQLLHLAPQTIFPKLDAHLPTNSKKSGGTERGKSSIAGGA